MILSIPPLPASPPPFTALLAELEFAQLQLIELLLTFTRTFDRSPSIQKLILTRQVRNDKDVDDEIQDGWS